MLDLDWITPGLAVGGEFPMAAAVRLARELRIRHVVDVRIERCDDGAVLRGHGIALLHLPTQDTCAIALPRIRDGVAWVRERLSRGERVLVHCQHGVGRSALLALCVLVAEGRPPLEALALAKRARRKVSPSPEQLEAFVAWCREVRAAGGVRWEVPTVEALGSIAWSRPRDDAPAP